ncbi:MAG: hypothetical protein M3Q16_00525 [Pseudomonadota bacterium]|nr:hypothetical protein [Pseudomonadota bacterium]
MNELAQLQESCLVLEEQAGLLPAMKIAREGHFIPLSGIGEQASSDEYYADKHDYFRDKTRDAYFSVQDVELRKKLIAAQRGIDAYIIRSFETDIAVVIDAVSVATAKTRNQPWMKAAVIAVGAMAIGYGSFAFGGAIAGAIAGCSYGKGVLSKAKNDAKIELEQAAQELEQVRNNQAQRLLRPESFSRSEEITGLRENYLDCESA